MNRTKKKVKVVIQFINYLEEITNEEEIACFINRAWAELFCNAYQETNPNVRLYIVEEAQL